MKSKSITVILVAAVMVVSMPMAAMASTTEQTKITESKTTTGNIEYTGTQKAAVLLGDDTNAYDGINATITGYVHQTQTDGYNVSSISDGTTAKPTNSTLIIQGVDADGNSIIAELNASGWNQCRGIDISGEGNTVNTAGNITVVSNGNLDVIGVRENGKNQSITCGDVKVKITNNTASGPHMGVHANNDGNFISAGNITVDFQGTSGVYGVDVGNGNDNSKDTEIIVKDITLISPNTSGYSYVNGINIWNTANNNINVTSGNITVTGSTDVTKGVHSMKGYNGTTSICVNGNINGAGKGMTLSTYAGAQKVYVDGDVNAIVQGIIINNSNGYSEVAVNGEVTGSESVFTVENTEADNYSISVYGFTKGKEEQETVLQKVNYIVRGNNNTADYRNMTFDSSQVSTVEINGKTYYTAKEGYITVTVDSDHELFSTTGLTRQGNTYTVSIPEGGYVTLEAILKAIEETKASFTGTEGKPVTGGTWNCGPGGYWTFRTDGIFKNTWGYITLTNGKTGWFWFDKYGVMQTGWQQIDGKWYYFNEAHDGTYGMMLTDTTTPDGRRVGADGVLIQ